MFHITIHIVNKLCTSVLSYNWLPYLYFSGEMYCTEEDKPLNKLIINDIFASYVRDAMINLDCFSVHIFSYLYGTSIVQ